MKRQILYVYQSGDLSPYKEVYVKEHVDKYLDYVDEVILKLAKECGHSCTKDEVEDFMELIIKI